MKEVHVVFAMDLDVKGKPVVRMAAFSTPELARARAHAVQESGAPTGKSVEVKTLMLDEPIKHPLHGVGG